MKHAPPNVLQDLDDLRLFGLSRIPRCSGCPRLEALKQVAEGNRVAKVPPPAVPHRCTDQVCDPMVARYVRAQDGLSGSSNR